MESLSAYHQLSPVEKMAVDTYVSELETNARTVGKRVVEFLEAGNQASNAEHYQARTKQAAWNANRILARPLVKAAIHERITELTRQMEIDAYKVLSETAAIAFSNIDDFVSIGGLGYEWDKLPKEKKRAVQSIKFKRDMYGNSYIEEIKLYNKLDGIEKLFKYMGLYDADNRQKAAAQSGPALVPASATPEQAGELYARTLRRA